MSAVCSVDMCDRPATAKGLCSAHWKRQVRGVPLGGAIAHRARTRGESLWARIQWTPTCWLWTGTILPHGYGKASTGRKDTTSAHRSVYELLVGPIPDGLHLDHLCRNRRCVNPAHLEPVTPAENTRRAYEARKVEAA